jgi:hypothetical protein
MQIQAKVAFGLQLLMPVGGEDIGNVPLKSASNILVNVKKMVIKKPHTFYVSFAFIH